jgi:hypothetical protein
MQSIKARCFTLCNGPAFIKHNSLAGLPAQNYQPTHILKFLKNRQVTERQSLHQLTILILKKTLVTAPAIIY